MPTGVYTCERGQMHSRRAKQIFLLQKITTNNKKTL